MNKTEKFYIFKISIAILGYLEAKFDYDYFILFWQWGPTILNKKFKVILTKIEEVTAVFVISRIGLLTGFALCILYVGGGGKLCHRMLHIVTL